MPDDERPQITTKVSQKKWILFLGALFFLIVIGMVLFTIFGGMELANPWGKQPGPGP